MKRLNKMFMIISLVFTVIVILAVFFTKNINEHNTALTSYKKYAIIGKQNIVAVFEDKLAIKIPYEIQADKNETFGDIVKTKNYSKLLESLNRIFPEKIDMYRVVKFGSVDLEVKNAKNIPETSIDDKRYILTSSVNVMFKELYKNSIEDNISFQDIVIDILNAKGRSGYARIVGEELKKEMNVKYTAANYEKISEDSYVILNDISLDKAEKIVSHLNEKYIKIKNDHSIPTLANIVFVLGKEETPAVSIEILGPSSIKEEKTRINKILNTANYKNIKLTVEDPVLEESLIEYSEENYFIAYKIGKIIGIKKLVQNQNVKNTIKIRVK